MVFFIDEFPAVAVGDGVLEIGPGHEVFLLYLRFEDEAAEFGGAEGGVVAEGEGEGGERGPPLALALRRTASDGDRWRPFGTVP